MGFSITLILMVMQFYTKYNVSIFAIYGIKLFFFRWLTLFFTRHGHASFLGLLGGVEAGGLGMCDLADDAKR